MNPKYYSKWGEREGFIIATHEENLFYHVFASEKEWKERKPLHFFTNRECLNSFFLGIRYVRNKEVSNE